MTATHPSRHDDQRAQRHLARVLGRARRRISRLVPALLAGVLVAPALSLLAPSVAAHAVAPGGPVVLDGMDSGYHGSESGGVTQTTWRFGQLVFQLLMGQSTEGTANTVAVVGATDSTATSNNCGAMAHYAAAALGYTVQYFPNKSDIDSMFAQIHAGTYSPRLIYVTDDYCPNGLSHVVDGSGNLVGDATLSAHSTDLASFVNRGGALYTEFSNYAWLGTLLPSISVGSSPTGSAPLLTPAGQSTFPTLTNAQIVAPWHRFFIGNLGPSLQALATQTFSGTAETVIIGGSVVTLPTVSTTTNNGTTGIGATATVTTTAENPDGSPVAGVTVTFTVASGPNAGATASIVTGADGTANYSYTSATAGTDVVTTSVTVSSQTYPGSASISWQAAHPTPPGIGGVSQTGGTAVVTVTPPASNGGAVAAPTYTVKAYPGGIASGSTPIVVTGAAGPNVTLTGLDPSLTYEVVATATNSNGTSGPSPVTWVGSAGAGWAAYATPTVAATTAPGLVNVAYAGSFALSGGVGPYAWTLMSGTLPAGLTLNGDGTITGTPTAIGTSTFMVMVMDGDGAMVMQTVTLAINPPAPTASPVTSAGSGAGTQSATVPVPTGGSVSLVNGSGQPVTVLVVPGVGTYAVTAATGVITFVPAAGFSGTAPAVSVIVTDAYNQTATTTYTVTVSKPAAPTTPSAPATSSGDAGVNQQVQVPVPSGDSITLVDATGKAVTSVTVAGQGTYVVNPVTGVITFTPVADYHGTATAVHFRITDGYGQSASGTYAASVTGAKAVAAKPTVRTASIGILRLHETVVPVTCKVSSGSVATCTVTLYAKVSGHNVVVGSGQRTVAGKGAKGGTTVMVKVNNLGRALAAVPDGVPVTAAVAIKAPGQHSWTYASGHTRMVAAMVLVSRQVFFSSGSSVLTSADRGYLNDLRHSLSGVRRVVCNGYTDSRDSAAYNLTLGKARATATCSYLLRGLHVASGPHTYGMKRPQADNGSAAGQAKNRRAEVYLSY
jgi:CshA-type fibril repeat protein